MWTVDIHCVPEQLAKTHLSQQVLDADWEEAGGARRCMGAHGRAERRFRQLSTKQQQVAPVGCHRHTIQRKLREDDAPIGTLGLPHEQLPARAQPPQGCGVASRRRPPLRILTVGAADPGAICVRPVEYFLILRELPTKIT